MVHDIEDPRSGTAGLRVKKYFKFSHALALSPPLTLSCRVLAELGPRLQKVCSNTRAADFRGWSFADSCQKMRGLVSASIDQSLGELFTDLFVNRVCA